MVIANKSVSLVITVTDDRLLVLQLRMKAVENDPHTQARLSAGSVQIILSQHT